MPPDPPKAPKEAQNLSNLMGRKPLVPKRKGKSLSAPSSVFNKDHDISEEGRSRTASAKQTASLQLLCTVGGNQARLDACTEFEILQSI